MYINVVQEIRMEFDTVATTEEYHYLLGFVFLQEGEEKEETLVTFTEDISLF